MRLTMFFVIIYMCASMFQTLEMQKEIKEIKHMVNDVICVALEMEE